MKKILVIGATSSIAEATIRLLAQDGHSFFLTSRHLEKLKILAQDLQVRGAQKVESAILDVNQFEQHEKIIQNARESLNGLDMVFIAHGSLGDPKASDVDYAIAEKEIKTNFLSIVSILTLIANEFEKEKKGTIVVISSVAGDRGRKGNNIYGTSKAALSTYLQGLRNRLSSSHIHVLTIKPGPVDTPMTAHLPKTFLFAKSEKIARDIYKAIQKKKEVVYTPLVWKLIMMIVRIIPEKIFKHLNF